MKNQTLEQEEIREVFDYNFDYEGSLHVLDAEEKIIKHKNILQKEIFKILAEIRILFKRGSILRSTSSLHTFFSLLKQLHKCNKKYVILVHKYYDLLNQQLTHLLYNDTTNYFNSLVNYRIFEKIQELQKEETGITLEYCLENDSIPITYIKKIEVLVSIIIKEDINICVLIKKKLRNNIVKKIGSSDTKKEEELTNILHTATESKNAMANLRRLKSIRTFTVKNARKLKWLRYILIGTTLTNILMEGIQVDTKIIERVDPSVSEMNFYQTPEAMNYRNNELNKKFLEHVAEVKKNYTTPEELRIFETRVKPVIMSTESNLKENLMYEYFKENAPKVKVEKTDYIWSTANWKKTGIVFIGDDILALLERVKSFFGVTEKVDNDLADGKLIDKNHAMYDHNTSGHLEKSSSNVKQFMKHSEIEHFEKEIESFKKEIVEEQLKMFQQEREFMRSFIETSKKTINFKKYSEKLLSIFMKEIEQHIQDENLLLYIPKAYNNDPKFKLYQSFKQVIALRTKFITTYNLFLSTFEPQINFALDMERFEEGIMHKRLSSSESKKIKVEFLTKKKDIEKGFAELKTALLELSSIPIASTQNDYGDIFELGTYLKIKNSLEKLKKNEKHIAKKLRKNYKTLAKLSMKQIRSLKKSMRSITKNNAITKKRYLETLLSGGNTYTGSVFIMTLTTVLIFAGTGGLNKILNLIAGPIFEFITNYNPIILDKIISKDRVLTDEMIEQTTQDEIVTERVA